MEFHWLRDIIETIGGSIINTPGGGGIIFGLVLGTAATTYLFAARWIMRGGDDDEATEDA